MTEQELQRKGASAARVFLQSLTNEKDRSFSSDDDITTNKNSLPLPKQKQVHTEEFLPFVE